MQILISIIRFPEISLLTRDAHKLRGYFGNLFREQSPLLHNHFDDGSLIFRYPLVQYKVIDQIPILMGLNEGADLLTSLFLKIKTLDIEGRIYEINFKNIENKESETGVNDNLNEYKFKTLWMGLNQENYRNYILCKDEIVKKKMLEKILTGNILSYFKSTGYFADVKILLLAKLIEKKTKFKGNEMLAFEGGFTTNAALPDLIGLGKSVSRGFGSIYKSD